MPSVLQAASISALPAYFSAYYIQPDEVMQQHVKGKVKVI